MTQVTWDDIIARVVANSRCFGDMEFQRDSSVIRGPIVGVVRNRYEVVIKMIWMASRDLRNRFVKIDGSEFKVNRMSNLPVEMDSEGTATCKDDWGSKLRLRLYGVQYAGHTLDPRYVEGLDGEDVRRSRARMFDLNDDATWGEIVKRVVQDLAGDGMIDVGMQIQVQKEAERFTRVPLDAAETARIEQHGLRRF